MQKLSASEEFGPDDVAGVQRRNLADALFKATTRCRFHRVKFLLDNGVSPLVTNDDGLNLLMAALYIQDEGRRCAMFDYLLKRGADACYFDPKTGRDVTAWAAFLGRSQQVQVVLETVIGEVNLHKTDSQGMTALHHAVIRGHLSVVQVLVKHMQKYGLTLDVPDKQGLTPYIYAKKLGYQLVAEELADGGCSVNQFDLLTFRSAEEWAEHGRKERQKQLQRELARERAGLIHKPKAPTKPARLPALTVTSTDGSGSVVFSIPGTSFTYPRQRKIPIRNDSFDSVYSSAMNMRLREDTSLLLSVASTSTNSVMHHSMNDNLTSVLDIMAQQCTHTFRKSTRPPTPEEKIDPFTSIAYVIKAGKKCKLKDPQTKSGHNISTVMSAFAVSKQITAEHSERKKRKSLVPVSL